jgi:predicted Zn-dependent protease
MRRGSRIVVAIVTMVASILLAAPQASAQTTYPTCSLPESNADALYILNASYPNKYVWGDTNLTVGVRAAPNVGQEYLDAIQRAITSWNGILNECFDGKITFTYTSDLQAANIIVHYVPYAGGTVFAGYAICGANGCPNILVRSEFSPGEGIEDYTPEYLYYVTLHELGHSLGLGHATNLRESTDLMGYGWIGDAPDPLFSQCDLDALAYIFSWALEGTRPPDPGPSAFEPTFVC